MLSESESGSLCAEEGQDMYVPLSGYFCNPVAQVRMPYGMAELNVVFSLLSAFYADMFHVSVLAL